MRIQRIHRGIRQLREHLGILNKPSSTGGKHDQELRVFVGSQRKYPIFWRVEGRKFLSVSTWLLWQLWGQVTLILFRSKLRWDVSKETRIYRLSNHWKIHPQNLQPLELKNNVWTQKAQQKCIYWLAEGLGFRVGLKMCWLLSPTLVDCVPRKKIIFL